MLVVEMMCFRVFECVFVRVYVCACLLKVCMNVCR